MQPQPRDARQPYEQERSARVRARVASTRRAEGRGVQGSRRSVRPAGAEQEPSAKRSASAAREGFEPLGKSRLCTEKPANTVDSRRKSRHESHCRRGIASTQRPSVARSWALKDDLVNLEADVAARNEAMALRSQSDLYGSASSWTVSFAAESDDDARCWLESLPWSQLVEQTRDSGREQAKYSGDERERPR